MPSTTVLRCFLRLLRAFVAGVTGQTEVIHPVDCRMAFQELGDGQRVIYTPLHTQGERFQADNVEEAVKRCLCAIACIAACIAAACISACIATACIAAARVTACII